MMRPLRRYRETRASISQIILDGCLLGRVRIRLRALGHPLDDLTDTELWEALIDGLHREMRRRDTEPPVSFSGYRERLAQAIEDGP